MSNQTKWMMTILVNLMHLHFMALKLLDKRQTNCEINYTYDILQTIFTHYIALKFCFLQIELLLSLLQSWISVSLSVQGKAN